MGRLLGFTEDDSGIALVVAIGAIALMFLLATAGFYASSQTLFESQLADRHDVAFQAASSGVMVALADLRTKMGSSSLVATYTGGVAGSTASYAVTATLNAARTGYDCVSAGVSRSGVREVVMAVFGVTTQTSSRPLWGSEIFYFSGGYPAGSINGGGDVAGAVFILMPPSAPPFPTVDFGGAMKLSGGPIYVQNGNFHGDSNGPLVVYSNGTATGKNVISKSLDATGALVVTRVDQPSFLTTSLANAIRQSTDNVLGDTPTSVQEATAPAYGPSSYGRTRYPGVVATGPYKVVGTPNNPVGLTIGGSTGSFGYVSGTLHDDFAYDKANKKLYVEGTVYINGNLTISQAITYEGNGTIVCTGAMNINADVIPSTGQPDSRHLLCGFATGNIVFGSSNMKCAGAFYTMGALDLGANKLTLVGSFASENGVVATGNSLTVTPLPLIGTYVAPGLPNMLSTSNGSGPLGLTVSSWRRL